MMRFALAASTAMLISGCTAPAPAADTSVQAEQAAAPTETSAPAPAAIEAAKVALAAEPKIKDLTYNGADVVQWNVGVLDDGSSRTGYAEYVCSVIAEKGALAGRTHVRIVDVAKVAQGVDFRAANLGHVICETGDVVDA